MRTRNADSSSKSVTPKKTPPARKSAGESPVAKRTPPSKTRNAKKAEASPATEPITDSNPDQSGKLFSPYTSFLKFIDASTSMLELPSSSLYEVVNESSHTVKFQMTLLG